MKNSFVLYTDYMEHLTLLSMEQRGVLFTAINAYASKLVLPEMDGITTMAFSFIKTRMDKDAEKYENIVEKRREAGKLGGRPKTDGLPEKQTEANGFSGKQNNPDNDSVNDSVNDNDKSKEHIGRFKPPTLDDVMGYCQEKGYAINAERFIDFYASKGWLVGKSKMKDWKASVRNWARQEREQTTVPRGPTKPKQTGFSNFDQRDTNYNAEVQRQTAEWLKEVGDDG